MYAFIHTYSLTLTHSHVRTFTYPYIQDDVLLLTEDDKRYWMGIGKSSSDRFIVAGVESKETSEYHVADLQAVKGTNLTCNIVRLPIPSYSAPCIK